VGRAVRTQTRPTRANDRECPRLAVAEVRAVLRTPY
jgi:hypothetical protein